jgi:hypothetical protein
VHAKFDQLKSLLRGCGRTLVAYSGGVDSTFLAKVAADVLGERMLAVIADTPSLPRREFTQALALAEQLHIPVRVIKTAGIEEWERLRRVEASPEQLKSMAQVLQRKRDLADDPHELTVTAGQIVGMIKKVVSVEELMGQILDEAQQICARLGALAPLASTR